MEKWPRVGVGTTWLRQRCNVVMVEEVSASHGKVGAAVLEGDYYSNHCKLQQLEPKWQLEANDKRSAKREDQSIAEAILG